MSEAVGAELNTAHGRPCEDRPSMNTAKMVRPASYGFSTGTVFASVKFITSRSQSNSAMRSIHKGSET